MTPAVRLAVTKLAVAIIFDIADFAGGWIPGFGTLFDAVLTVVAVVLFGWKGLFQLWELANVPFDVVDGFVPTLTLIALAELRAAKRDEAAETERRRS